MRARGWQAFCSASARRARATIVEQFVRATAANFRAHKGLFRAIVERGIDHPQAMKTIFDLREELAAALESALRGAWAGREICANPFA